MKLHVLHSKLAEPKPGSYLIWQKIQDPNYRTKNSGGEWVGRTREETMWREEENKGFSNKATPPPKTVSYMETQSETLRSAPGCVPRGQKEAKGVHTTGNLAI